MERTETPALFMLARLSSLALLVAMAVGCAADRFERHSVLQLDACGGASLSEPVDLEQQALEAGCATASMGGWGVLDLRVEAVVSPLEFVVKGRYGRERIRPAYAAGTAAELRRLDAHQLEELGARLDGALAGRTL